MKIQDALQAFRVGVANWILLVAGVVNLVAGTVYSVAGNATLAGTGIGAGLILLFAATVERFELIKGLGLEAKTRALTEKIQQADEVLASLRELTEFICPSLIELNARTGRWDSTPSAEEFYQLARSVKQVLSKVGSNDATLRAALLPWAQVTAFDAVARLVGDLQSRLQARQEFGALTTVQNVTKAVFESRTDRSPEGSAVLLERLCKENLGLSAGEQEDFVRTAQSWIPELRYLGANLELRDKETWFRLLARV